MAKEPNYSSSYGDGFPLSTSLPGKLKEDARTRLENQLEEMVRKIPSGTKLKATVLWGNPVKGIVRAAESGNFDLIVMATHGRKGMSSFFIGSVTEEVIRRAPCPVLSIRAKVMEERAEVSTLKGEEIS